MRFVLPLLCLLAVPSLTARSQVNVWTYHNDNGRTGANTNETILTPANVNTNTFGKMFSYTVDGYVYAQPLYVANVAVTNKGVHNVVFVVTEHDSVYAFDADSNTGTNSVPLWQRSFINPGSGITTVSNTDVNTTDIVPEIGITGTPVIDVAAGTLYLVAKTKQVSGSTTNYFQWLHALDITTGNDRSNSPVSIAASVPGNGEGSSGGNLPFSPLKENQRSALLLLNNVVYMAWASHGDNSPYHGWVMGYDAHTLQQLCVFNANPNGVKCGIWQAGGGLAADLSSNIFCLTGNGTFDGPTNNDYGDSLLKLHAPGTSLTLADYFTPYNQATLSVNDTDLGSGGLLVLPDSVGSATHPHLMVGAGKQGTVYLVDRDNLGHYNTANDSQIVQSLIGGIGVCLSSPAYFNNRLYYMAYNDHFKIFSITNGHLSTSPISQGSQVAGIFGASPSISANGTNNAVAWILLTDAYKTQGPAVLHAFDAYNLTNELYNSAQSGARDVLGGAVKFTLPTVANGKVYIGTETTLAVFGSIAYPVITAQPQSQTITNGSALGLSVGVSSSGPYTAQWLFDGATIPGATSTNYTILHAQLTNAGTYSVIISNSYGSTTSSLAYVSIVSQLTNAPGSILAPPGMVDWWPADGNAIDIFGSINGTPQGAFSYAPGESGLAFNFDGSTSVVNLSSASDIPVPWTACMWVNRQNSPQTSAVLIGDNIYSLKLEQYNGTRELGMTHLSVADYVFSPAYIVPTNTWVHLAFVGTSSNTVVYANGVLQGSISTNIPLPRAYLGVTYVTSPGKYIDFMLGALDEVMLFNRALTPTEINAIYAAGSAGLVRAPQTTSFGLNGSGQFTMNLIGQTGKTFTIYSSTNLTDWTLLSTLSNPSGAVQFIDTNAPNSSRKFYRISQP